MFVRTVLFTTCLLVLGQPGCRVEAPPFNGVSRPDGRAPVDAIDGGLDASTTSRPIDGPRVPPPSPPPPPPPPGDPPDAAPDAPPDAAPDTAPDLPPVAASGLVGHWKFDEDSGNMASDSSGSGNHGLLGPGAVFVPGGFPGAMFQNPRAIDFDGLDGRVVLTVNRLPAAEASKSISFWVNYPAASAAIQAMLSLTNGLAACGVQIGFRGGQLAVWGWAGAILASAPPPPPGWHNVIYTFDGLTHTLVLDGATSATTTEPPQSCAITDAVVSGYAGGAENFLGTLDDLRIYDRALSPTEISTVSKGGDPG